MTIGISGSAVRSETDRLHELFRPDVEHIEIGLFENIGVADRFVRQARARGKTVGIHSPLLRGGAKNNLMAPITGSVDEAWEQVETELTWCGRSGVRYLLVHFPFVNRSDDLRVHDVVASVHRLSNLGHRYGVDVVCEPKLGAGRNPAEIGWLRTAPTRIFSPGNVSLCWDVGDHLLASRSPEDFSHQFDRWKHAISVIHLHNVRMAGRQYRWVPPHPLKSAVNADYDLGPVIQRIPHSATIVCEYTPQQVATTANIDTSYHYLKAMTQED